MKATPDASGRFGRALNGFPLERFDFCTRRIKQQLDLLLDGGDLETIKRNDLVAVVN